MFYCCFWYLVPLKKILPIFFITIVNADVFFYECKKKDDDNGSYNLAVDNKGYKIIFNDDIYVFNSLKDNKIFAQKREILKTSFIEFNKNNFNLKQVNSWLHKVTKDNYVCKKTDSKIGYK